MTCIAGLVHNGTVYLAGDSAGCSGWDLRMRADPKVFRNGPYVMGFTSSFRMGQLLRYAFNPPIPEPGDLQGFMCTTFIDALRACLKDGGWASKSNEKEEGGCFLVGINGQLFMIDTDYQVARPADPYTAVGCGAQIAHGALYATETADLIPADRLEVALEAAERFSNGVRAPFHHTDTARSLAQP